MTSSRTWRAPWLVLVAAAIFGASGAQAEVARLAPRPLEAESYGETFTAILDLDDGTYALAQLLFTNAGIGDERALCRVLIVPPGEPGTNRAHAVSRSGWQHDPATNTLSVGPCTLTARESETLFAFVVDDLSLRGSIRAPARAVRPPDARVLADAKFQESEVLVPWAPAWVDYIAPGRSRRGAQAGAYLDHARGDAMPRDLAQRFYRFRALRGSDELLVQVRIPRQGGPPVAWVWAHGEPAPVRLASEAVSLSTRGGRPRLELASRRGNLTIEAVAPLFEYRPTESNGVLGWLARPWIGNPVSTTFRATVRTSSGAESGILEHQDLSR